MRRRRMLFARFVARMKDTRLPKCVMFGKLVGGAGCVGEQEKEWMGCLLVDLRANCCRLPTASVLGSKIDKSRSNQFRSTSPSFSRSHVIHNKKKNNTEFHDCGGLELVRPVREAAFSRPKPCASLKKLQGSCHSPLFVGPRRKKENRCQISAFPSEISRLAPAFDSRAQGFIQHSLARRRSRCPPPPPNLLPYQIERATVYLRVLRRSTRLSATVPPAFRVPPPPEGHQIGTWKKRTGRTPSSTNQPAAASQSTG